MQLPPRYHEIIWPLIGKAKGFLEKGEKLAPFAFVGNFDTGEIVSILIDTEDESRKDASAIAIRLAAESMAGDYVFTVIEGWGLPKDRMLKYEEIIERYGSIGASPYKIDTANFMLETRYGVWGAQVPLKFKATSKKRRTFAALLGARAQVPSVRLFPSGGEKSTGASTNSVQVLDFGQKFSRTMDQCWARGTVARRKACPGGG